MVQYDDAPLCDDDIDTTNAINYVMTRRSVVKHYGREISEIKRRWCLAHATLNTAKDEPLPAWVIEVINLKEISFKSRIKVLLKHGEQIEERISKNQWSKK